MTLLRHHTLYSRLVVPKGVVGGAAYASVVGIGVITLRDTIVRKVLSLVSGIADHFSGKNAIVGSTVIAAVGARSFRIVLAHLVRRYNRQGGIERKHRGAYLGIGRGLLALFQGC